MRSEKEVKKKLEKLEQELVNTIVNSIKLSEIPISRFREIKTGIKTIRWVLGEVKDIFEQGKGGKLNRL